jgi:hypothetical protein
VFEVPWFIQNLVSGYNWSFWAAHLGPRNATMIAMMTTAELIFEISGLVTLVLLVRRRWRKAAYWAGGGTAIALLVFVVSLFFGQSVMGGGHS